MLGNDATINLCNNIHFLLRKKIRLLKNTQGRRKYFHIPQVLVVWTNVCTRHQAICSHICWPGVPCFLWSVCISIHFLSPLIYILYGHKKRVLRGPRGWGLVVLHCINSTYEHVVCHLENAARSEKKCFVEFCLMFFLNLPCRRSGNSANNNCWKKRYILKQIYRVIYTCKYDIYVSTIHEARAVSDPVFFKRCWRRVFFPRVLDHDGKYAFL